MLTWEARERTRGDDRGWVVTAGAPDPHPLLSERYPERRLHRVPMRALEEHWQLDGAILNSGYRLLEVVPDDGDGGHVWFEEVPGWVDPRAAPPAPASPPDPPSRAASRRDRP